MSNLKLYRCVRCGIEVHNPRSACNDCVATDPVTVRLLRPTPRPAAEVIRPPDCPTPSRSTRDRHLYRGEPACQACANHHTRPRTKATT